MCRIVTHDFCWNASVCIVLCPSCLIVIFQMLYSRAEIQEAVLTVLYIWGWYDELFRNTFVSGFYSWLYSWYDSTRSFPQTKPKTDLSTSFLSLFYFQWIYLYTLIFGCFCSFFIYKHFLKHSHIYLLLLHKYN